MRGYKVDRRVRDAAKSVFFFRFFQFPSNKWFNPARKITWACYTFVSFQKDDWAIAFDKHSSKIQRDVNLLTLMRALSPRAKPSCAYKGRAIEK